MKQFKVRGLTFISIICLFCIFSCQSKKRPVDALEYKGQELKAYEQLLAAKPDSTGLRVIVASKLDSLGRYSQALMQIDTLLIEDSANYALRVLSAEIYLHNRDTSSAMNQLRKAYAKYPGVEATERIQEIYARQGNDSCLINMQSASATEGKANYVNYVHGIYYAKIGQIDKAISSLDSNIQQFPKFEKSYLEKASLLTRQNNINAAKQLLLKTAGLNGLDIATSNALGQLYLESGQRDSAGFYFEKSLKLQPFQPYIDSAFKSIHSPK